LLRASGVARPRKLNAACSSEQSQTSKCGVTADLVEHIARRRHVHQWLIESGVVASNRKHQCQDDTDQAREGKRSSLSKLSPPCEDHRDSAEAGEAQRQPDRESCIVGWRPETKLKDAAVFGTVASSRRLQKDNLHRCRKKQGQSCKGW
jgi:hypothetical protein